MPAEHTITIEMTDGRPADLPNALQASIGDTVRWKINLDNASAIIVFIDQSAVQFLTDHVATHEQEVQVTVRKEGTHYYAIVAWEGDMKPGAITDALIIDPRPIKEDQSQA